MSEQQFAQHPAPALTDLLVELHVPSFEPVEQFYGTLGFTPVRRETRYLVMRRERTILNFYGGDAAVGEHSYFGSYPHDTKRGYGVEIVIFVSDLDAVFDVAHQVAKVLAPPARRPWGCRDFRIEDPFGFYLRISEPYDATGEPARAL